MLKSLVKDCKILIKVDLVLTKDRVTALDEIPYNGMFNAVHENDCIVFICSVFMKLLIYIVLLGI